MRKRYGFAALCLALLLFAGCGAGREKVGVWRAVRTDYLAGGRPSLEAEIVYADASLSEIDAAVAAFNSPASEVGLARALPEGLDIIGWELAGTELRLYVPAEYASFAGYARAAAESCAALTFCALEVVESVSFYSGETALSEGLRPGHVLLEDETGAVE